MVFNYPNPGGPTALPMVFYIDDKGYGPIRRGVIQPDASETA